MLRGECSIQAFPSTQCLHSFHRIFLVNSPIVRAENLRFREDGVKEVVARVLLPWVNAFRFFLGQVMLLERDAGIKFKYKEHAPVSSNVMDRWILARCQSLIKLVREEMAGEELLLSWYKNQVTDKYFNWNSISVIHCYSTVTIAHRRVDELVHSLQPSPLKGRWRTRRYCRRPQHPVRNIVHTLQDNGAYGTLVSRTCTDYCLGHSLRSLPSSRRVYIRLYENSCPRVRRMNAPSISSTSPLFVKSILTPISKDKSRGCKPLLSLLEHSETSINRHSRLVRVDSIFMSLHHL